MTMIFLISMQVSRIVDFIWCYLKSVPDEAISKIKERMREGYALNFQVRVCSTTSEFSTHP